MQLSIIVKKNDTLNVIIHILVKEEEMPYFCSTINPKEQPFEYVIPEILEHSCGDEDLMSFKLLGQSKKDTAIGKFIQVHIICTISWDAEMMDEDFLNRKIMNVMGRWIASNFNYSAEDVTDYSLTNKELTILFETKPLPKRK